MAVVWSCDGGGIENWLLRVSKFGRTVQTLNHLHIFRLSSSIPFSPSSNQTFELYGGYVFTSRASGHQMFASGGKRKRARKEKGPVGVESTSRWWSSGNDVGCCGIHGPSSGSGPGEFQYMNSPFGDTTFTKVFVGGLAWETQSETLRRYFEQFGEILEAVVIADKNTGRSKGYDFVTFLHPESARRACADPSPIIDGITKI